MIYFLNSDRLGFRKWSQDDLPIAMDLWGDQAVTELIDTRGALSKDQVQEKLDREIERDQKYGVQYWPIFLMKTNENIGCCGLRPYDLDKGIYEVGFHIRSAHWRKGYASEAARAVIDYAFNQLNANALFAGHNPKNTASKLLLEKLGFKYTHDEFYEPTGLKHPSYLLFPNKK